MTFLILLLIGCNKEKDVNYNSKVSKVEDSKKDIIEIKEKMFITQCNDIYLNPKEYENKLIKLEGMYDEYHNPTTNETYNFVMRYGPGCCGNDGEAGFRILYNGDLPKKDDWVEAVGKVKVINNGEDIVLALESLKVLETRGKEFVEN